MININKLIEKVTRDNERLEQLIKQNKRTFQPSKTEVTEYSLPTENDDYLEMIMTP